MFTGWKIRFQHWAMATTLLLVAFLSAAFLLTVFRTFKGISEETATTRFALIAGQAANQIENKLKHNGMYVAAQAHGELDRFLLNGRIDQAAVVPEMLSALEQDPALYSRFIGLANEEFLQVIAIRGDERIGAALQAPADAHFAVRRILPDGQGRRTDYYQFLDQARQQIDVRHQEATLQPTQRPWYAKAIERNGLAVTDPYLFASTGELGISVAAPLSGQAGVIATDLSLRALQSFVEGIPLPANGAIAVLDGRGRILAFHGKGARFADAKFAPMIPADDPDAPGRAILLLPVAASGSQIVALADVGDKQVVTQHLTEPVGGASFRIVVWAPFSDFTSAFVRAERDVVLLAIAVLLVLLPLTFLGSRQVAHALATLASDSERLKRMDFSHAPRKPETFVYEVDALGAAQLAMHDEIQKRTKDLIAAQDKLENLIQTGLDLGRERDRMALLRKVLFGGKTLLNCDAGTLYMVTERKTLRFALRTKSDELPSFEIPLYEEGGAPVERYMATWCALHNAPVVVDDVYQETRFDVTGARKMDEETGYRSVSMLTVPLSPREGEVIGVLQFLNALDPHTGAVIPFPPELLRFVTAMAAQAAVALDNHQLLEAQEQLMDALIRLIAGAIDAKSPYTGGHCERVPELAMMLAEEAGKVATGPLADFRFRSEEEWREFRIGAWLHDCGKVTTPEYVVDKASKLETIYNRIHEVRMRFEVLLRDARIDQLEAVAAGADPAQALAAYAARQTQLADDFAFVAECNLGGELMAADKLERLQRIAAQTWQRHFDDRLGLPHAELKRYQGEPAPLPATEDLLADKPHHIVPRTDTRSVDPEWGFKIKVPEHLYNYGEVYNLGIGRGTLTEEERFKINEHVMQSLMMLEQLPLPKSLQRIPEYAGTHHETLIGTGYPRKLTDAELSVPMRIMAIADVFEALTASDRPYKKTKTLSESIRILAGFKKDRHIDPHLFDLFLTSGIYLRYAEKYLKPEQIDAVDISQFVG